MKIKTAKTLCTMAVLLVTATSLYAENWLTGWSFRKTITIDHEQVDADLTDFPILVQLGPNTFDFGLSAPDGRDIRFTAADGETLLSFERETHDATSKTAAYWVKLPHVSASSDTTFYLYSGKNGAVDAATPTAVWDAGHVGVWHLHETNGVTQADSTTAGNHLMVGPVGLDDGDVAISDCDDLTGWSVTGDDATLSVDTATKDTYSGSTSSIKMAVTTTAEGQTNTLTYKPATPLVLGNRRLDYYYVASPKFSTFLTAHIYLYDTEGNYRRHNLNTSSSTGNTIGYSMISGGTTGGIAPNLNAIDRIEWVLVSKDSTAYTLNIDTLHANGAIEEGTPGAIAKGVTFSGNDHYLITASQNIDTTNGISLSAWVRPHETYVYWPYESGIVGFGGANWGPYYQTLLNYRSGGLAAGASSVSRHDSYQDYASLGAEYASLTAGAWHHVAAVFHYDHMASSSTMKVYVDGVLQVNQSKPGRALRPLLARPICVGAKTQSAYPGTEPEQNIHGDLDEVRVSNICRSDAWIKTSFLNQKADATLLSMTNTESKGDWLTGWKRRYRLTLNATAVEADLTNFPVLVRLTSNTFDFSNAEPDGADIRFMSGDGKFFLPFERESHDPTAQTAAYWVRIPLISATADTTFYLYCSKSGATDAATPDAVWDSGHIAVWHLHETNGVTQADSTGDGNDLAVGPAGLDHGDVAISDCDSTTGWSITGPAASLAIDTVRRDTIAGSPSSIQLTVATAEASQTNTLVYKPSEPLVLGNRRLDFYFYISKTLGTAGFSTARVYLYDTNENYRYHDLVLGNDNGTRGYGMTTKGTTGGTDPDVNAIDRIEWVLVSADARPYTLNIDTLYANGAMEEGTSGAIAKGVTFSGTDHYLITSGVNIDTTNGLTLSAWVRQQDYSPYANRSYLSIINIGGPNVGPYYQTLLGYYRAEKVIGRTHVSRLDVYPDDATCDGQGAGFTTGVWHHVVGVYHYDHVASNTTVKVYIDGELQVDESVSGRALRPLLTQRICVGAMAWSAYPGTDPQYHISGDLDEVRVSNVARSEAWLKASFQNQKAKDTLLTIGRVEPPLSSMILLR